MLNNEEKKYLFQLIGYPLSYSRSPELYREFFKNAGIGDYAQYELQPVDELQNWVHRARESENLIGFNVTTPYKLDIIEEVDLLVGDAEKIGAVNTVVVKDNVWIGFNTDAKGFSKAYLDSGNYRRALILGTGGAASAVKHALLEKEIKPSIVSRDISRGDMTYSELDIDLIDGIDLIINATPLGSGKYEHTKPLFPYQCLSEKHTLIDLNYNPQKTLFLAEGTARGSKAFNGFEMLRQQALEAWKIWTLYHPYLGSEWN